MHALRGEMATEATRNKELTLLIWCIILHHKDSYGEVQ